MKKGERICYVLAAACLLLGMLLRFVYTAVRFTGFLFLCAAAILVIFALLTRWKEKRRWALLLRRALLAFLAVGFAFFAALEVRVISWARTDNETPVTAIIVLGAGVNGTEPSLSLRTRLETALAYAQERPDVPIIVSGSQGKGEFISEAQCMSNWLAGRGVPPERIWLEEQADNTKENIAYSLAMLSERGMDPAGSIAVVSSDYHLCRASMYMAGNMVPVAAHMPVRYFLLTLNYYVREAFGVAAELAF
ncbi:MAG: YdcF family protein [Oscillospiraceae bacterium]|nr:YdcF family protein [Oscillospiraceae bacterium]